MDRGWMSGHPAPTRSDHQRFCLNEGWEETVGARGGRGDHWRYTLSLPDGRMLYTRISHPISKRDTYGATLWRKILRTDLQVTEDEFWDCVRHKVRPQRGTPDTASKAALPIALYRLLLNDVGLSPAEIASLDAQQAAARVAAHYARGGRET